jgi:hypothetical protein
VPPDIWKELAPTSGEYIERTEGDVHTIAASCYHFFWKPSPWNRFVLVHRPDICMPGVGWTMDGPMEARDVDLDGHALRCYLFRFRRGNVEALQLWGVWRNGDAVPLDYLPAQLLGAAVPPPALHLEGKRRSATEIISCSVLQSGGTPSEKFAERILNSVFQFRNAHE